MAFDDKTRNRLSNFVSKVRELLSEEFASQFRNVYGLDPDSGEIASLDDLPTLSDTDFQTAETLRELYTHYLANSPKQTKTTSAEILDRMVREQAFTVLNRLCAIRLAEARDLILECIAQGHQSKGFQLYSRLAGTALGETGETYEQYLFSVFDELAFDLPVLFDRYSEHGRLFPRQSVLTEVLAEINHHELSALWAEDETIGWIYQYFNTKEERKAMRDAVNGGAPRNSRELAVRNQFFTPRYVVEFLTDNTLGRIWYEMRKGDTRLADECQYLVRRPNEIFEEYDPDQNKIEAQASESSTQSEKDADQPEDENASPDTDLTQEELLNQPVHIPHRPLKDPREIRMLDPACGSMHFGLYAFDLYLKIYEEYWDLVTNDPSVVVEPIELQSLSEAYQSREAFLCDVPRLIIEHNIHGIDIDPRAVQIAGLSLWLRAQRAWKSQGLSAQDRPQVTRSNVVCAEPMPGDQQQLEAFCKQLHPAIAQMVTAIFEEMKLAGEAGSLLKIEQEISSLVAAAKEQWKQQPVDKQMELFGGASVSKAGQLEFDLSGITDELFFEKAEEEIYTVLNKYASESSSRRYRRKLFANDAEKGFAFIELSQKIFSVMLMNPPFGEFSGSLERYLKQNYPSLCGNILCGFIERSNSVLEPNGKLGCIVDKTVAVKSSYSDIRDELLADKPNPRRLTLLADLGWGVLDGAQVETVSFVVERPIGNEIVFLIDQENAKLSNVQRIIRPATYFNYVPNKSLAYDIPADLLSIFARNASMEPGLGDARQGLGISDSWRWYRGIHEIPRASNSYAFLTNGGGFSPFYREPALALYWEGDGSELKVAEGLKYGSWSRTIKNVSYYYRQGLSFPKRTDNLNAHLLPEGFIFTVEGLGFFPRQVGEESSWLAMCLLNSRLQAYLINRFCGQHKHVGYLKKLPFKTTDTIEASALLACKRIVELKRKWSRRLPSSVSFVVPALLTKAPNCTLGDVFAIVIEELNADQEEIEDLESRIDQEVFNLFEIEKVSRDLIMEETQSRPKSSIFQGISERTNEEVMPWMFDLIDYSLGIAFGRFGSCESTLVDVSVSHFSKPDFPKDFNADSSQSGVIPDSIDGTDTISETVRTTLKQLWGASAERSEKEFLELSNVDSFSDFFGDSLTFFNHHLATYSFGRREFPIYWPISTESGSYTLWFYYHRLTDQTLYKAVNDFVDPKLKETLRQLADLRAIKDRSSPQEKELAQLTELEFDLTQFKADLLEIAAFWKPNLNDGVQITAAPLYKFFRHKKWRDKLAKTWKELQDGKYDWAHLALSIWPDRVVREKCTTDRSIAIAHDLEEQLWEEVEVTSTSRGGRETSKLKWQPKELSEVEIDKIIDAVKSRN